MLGIRNNVSRIVAIRHQRTFVELLQKRPQKAKAIRWSDKV